MTLESHSPLDSLSDGELLVRVASARDHEAFNELYRRYERAFFNLAFKLTGCWIKAEESVQESAVTIWRSASTYRPEGNARGWMYRIIVRHSLKITKKQRLKTEVPMEHNLNTKKMSHPETPIDDASHAEMLHSLRAAVSELPSLSRQVLTLYYGAGLSQREIGLAISIPERTVSHKLKETLGALRECMTKSGYAATIAVALDSGLREAILSEYPAPPGLHQKVLGKLLNGTSQSVRGSIQISRLAKFSKSFLLTFTISFALIVGVLWHLTQEKSVQNSGTLNGQTATALSQPRTANSPAKYTWDFNNATPPDNISVTEGNWHWIPKDGPDGSGCMETEGPLTTLVLHVPIPRLPVMVTMRVKERIKDNHHGSLALIHWTKNTGAADFRNISAMFVDLEHWTENTYFVTDKFIGGRWSPGNEPLHFLYTSRRDDSELSISFANAVHQVDDIKIQEIQPAQVPDFSAFVDAIERIEPSKRVGEVPILGLKSARPPKPVSIFFYPPIDEK